MNSINQIRDAQTYEFPVDTDTDDTPTFVLAGSEPSRYGEKAVIEAPAPWDTPDGMTPANDVIKGLDWADVHYAFDGRRKVWTIDVDAIDTLREAATDAGYDWSVGQPRREPDALDDLAADAESDMVIEVRYAKKNGNGENTIRGTVIGADDLSPYVAIMDDAGKRKQIKPDDDGVASLFSAGMYPYMGRVVEITIGH